MRAWMWSAAALVVICQSPALAAPRPYDERPAKAVPDTSGWTYERRIAEIPMRDGVKLHTVILVPKGAPARRC